MTETSSNDLDWIRAWIDQQRAQLQRFSSEGASVDARLQDQLHDIGGRWLDVIEAWRAQWAAPSSDEQDARQRLSDLLGRWPPFGPGREQTRAWREFAAARHECQKLEQALRATLVRVQIDALELLERRVRGQHGLDESVRTFRELYDLWVECGEQVYSEAAHSEEYCSLLAELGNATMRLRAREQALIEDALKRFDLPTRSELNTVHRQIRELRNKVAALEAQLAGRTEGAQR